LIVTKLVKKCPEDHCLLGYLPTFQRNRLSPSSGQATLKMDEASYSETITNIHQSTQYHVPEGVIFVALP
jgi:hypothetical protein